VLWLKEGERNPHLPPDETLFNHPGEEGIWAPQKPDSGVTVEEEAEYFAKLKQTQVAYADLKSGKEPLALPSGKNCADELAEVSRKLDTKYKDAMDKWVKEVIEGVDILTGQGGDVVNMNMAFQANQMVAKHLITTVRAGKTMYAAHSAGTMCMAKSMEMSDEVTPGTLKAFSCSKEFLKSDGIMFDANDLDDDGISANVLGALPMFESPFAMRPHFKESWMDDVLKANKKAEAEFEAETGKDIADSLVQDSADGVHAALKLLNIVGGKNSKDQDHPIFLPLHDGLVIVGQFTIDGHESFHVTGKVVAPANTAG